jgi:hypothetical protein
MSTSRPLSLAALAAVGPLLIIVACGGGTPDPKTAGGGGETTTSTATQPTAVPVASTSTSADDGDEDDTIPTADIVCKHLQDVLKGKAGALQTCVAELEKKQTDDVNYYVCYAGCTMSATSAEAAEACKAKCKK